MAATPGGEAPSGGTGRRRRPGRGPGDGSPGRTVAVALLALLLAGPAAPTGEHTGTVASPSPSPEKPSRGAGGGASSGDGSARPASVPDTAALRRALRRSERIEPLSSLLISWRGRLVAERYRHGMGPDRPTNVKSVSKTLLHPLVGAAIRDGHLEGVHQPLAELLPEAFDRELDPRKREITLGQLLSMTAGLETTSFGNYGAWVGSRDWVRHAVERPLECDPGRCWEYSTGNTHLVSVILTRATGVSTLAYARRVLFEPLGIRPRPWDRDPQGYYLGGNNMALTPRELLRFAELYLNFGRWEGEQVVPVPWVLASWQPRGRSPWNRHGYGYLWWLEEWGGERAYFGWGYGGQYAVVVPSLELAIAATSELSLRRRGHILAMRRFFDRWLVPAFAAPPVRSPDGNGLPVGAASPP